MYKAEYDHKLGIASLESSSGLKALTLMQNPGSKRPSINAFLGARYSRSAESVRAIAQDIMESGADAAAKLEAIFHGYGHKSVGAMADVFICIENVPMLTAMRFFNMNPVVAGQERSSRYQAFGGSQWRQFIYADSVARPAELELDKEYSRIMQKQLDDYMNLLTPTTNALSNLFDITTGSPKSELNALKSRSFDVARHLLPIGLNTSFGAVMNAQMWSEYISYMRGSSQTVERELGELLYALLVGNDELRSLGYVPEIDGLIKHADANSSREQTTQTLKELFQQLHEDGKVGWSHDEDTMAQSEPNAHFALVEHICLLIDPLLQPESMSIYDWQAEQVGRIIFSNHSHHNQLGTLAQSGAIALQGMTDLGSLKDLNRHRSLERFIPLLDNCVNLDAELARDDELCFEVCHYLNQPGLFGLRKQYRERLQETYRQIKIWYQKARLTLGEEVALEYARYLLPHAHKTAYRIYGSIDDLAYTIQLRIRPGGHFNYRVLVLTWLLELIDQNPFWQPLLEKLDVPDPNSREQFLDRS